MEMLTSQEMLILQWGPQTKIQYLLHFVDKRKRFCVEVQLTSKNIPGPGLTFWHRVSRVTTTAKKWLHIAMFSGTLLRYVTHCYIQWHIVMTSGTLLRSVAHCYDLSKCKKSAFSITGQLLQKEKASPQKKQQQRENTKPWFGSSLFDWGRGGPDGRIANKAVTAFWPNPATKFGNTSSRKRHGHMRDRGTQCLLASCAAG